MPKPRAKGETERNAPVPSTVKLGDDFHGWLLDQASALRARNPLSLDWDNVVEELEAMASRDRREIKERLKNLPLNLLKFKYQSDEVQHHHSWRSSIREAREQIEDILDDSPGIFQGERAEFLAIAYSRARQKAADESDLSSAVFPAACPWSFDQIMQPDFFS